jgi:hypothetical protein
LTIASNIVNACIFSGKLCCKKLGLKAELRCSNALEAISKMSYDPTRQRRTSVFVGDSFQILEILKYVCGLKLVPAATLNHNPIFEMASIINYFRTGGSPAPARGLFIRIELSGTAAPRLAEIPYNRNKERRVTANARQG